MKFDKILISQNAFDSAQPYDMINSNITVVNLLREEGVEDEDIHEDALASYCVDFYLAQYNNGNFSQFVWNTRWNKELNQVIADGLSKMNAIQHLALFREQSAKVEALGEDGLTAFLQRDLFGPNKTRDSLKNALFYELDEKLVELNATWLRSHPKLLVVSIDEMFAEIERFLGRPVER